jgi:hypothetical protein
MFQIKFKNSLTTLFASPHSHSFAARLIARKRSS